MARRSQDMGTTQEEHDQPVTPDNLASQQSLERGLAELIRFLFGEQAGPTPDDYKAPQTALLDGAVAVT